MMQNILEYLSSLPELQNMFAQVNPVITLLIQEFSKNVGEGVSQEQIQKYKQQFRILFMNLKNIGNTSILKDQTHRELIIQVIKKKQIELYKYSYFNRAKLSRKHIQHLNRVGTILFCEAVMIASKVSLINKNFSRIFIQDHLYTQRESPVDIKIQQILKLCDQKKRNANNNYKKLELILQGQGTEHVEVIKQLGKMLRDSWKKDKSKTKCNDFVKDSRQKQQVESLNNNFDRVRDQQDEKQQINSIDKKSVVSDPLFFNESQQNEIDIILYAKHGPPKDDLKSISDPEIYSQQQSVFDV